MKSTNNIVAASSLLIALARLVAADNFTIRCDGNQLPNWDDCNTIANAAWDTTAGALTINPTPAGNCIIVGPPSGTDADSLNCEIQVCTIGSDPETFQYQQLSIDYSTVKTQCDYNNAGGQITDNTHGDIIFAMANPNYRSSTKREITPASLTNSRLFGKRQSGDCTDGKGTFNLIETNVNIQMPDEAGVPITGRLPAGSTYTIMESDAKTVMVTVSASVSADFFEVLSADAGVTITGGETSTSTTGITINVSCATGQEGVIYFYPVYTEYSGLCASNNNQEIDTWVPNKEQTNYAVTCLDNGT